VSGITISLIVIEALIVIAVFLGLFVYYRHSKKIYGTNKEVKKQNEELSQQNETLKDNIQKLENDYSIQNANKIQLEQDYNLLNHNYQTLKTQEKDTMASLKNLTALSEEQASHLNENVLKGFENYCVILDNDYEKKEKEYQRSLCILNENYAAAQKRCEDSLNEANEQLQKVRNTRTAAIEALKREQEIKEQLSFYCLQPTQLELDDVKRLEAIKPQLHNPRILSMLIWSTYFQKPMTTLCNNVLGTTPICGIYKITNQINGMCYVGQSVNTQDRWKQHAKCGLGIDTPQGNKLYKAMISDGLWNFSFELLEACPREQLNEKEKYYIELYQSKDYGYNTAKGIGE
jgi:hypothetical protein